MDGRQGDPESSRVSSGTEPAEDRERPSEEPLPASASGEEASAPEPAERLDGRPQLDNIYFRQLFENSPDGIVLLDSQDRVLDVNRGFERLFGYTAEEARDQPINSLIVPPDSFSEASALSDRAMQGRIAAAERARRCKDGSRVEVRILGYPIFDGRRQIGIFGIYSDITFRRRVEQRLRLQGAAMKSVANAIFITDREGRIEWVNLAFCRLSGYAEEDVLGRTPEFLCTGSPEPGSDPALWQSLSPGQVWRGQVVNCSRDGGSYTVEQTVTPLAGFGRGVSHFVVVQEDVSARLEAEERLRHMAGHDFLTDLPNRYDFTERLKIELERAERSGRALALLVLDLDNFKDVNDAFGHSVGDELLIAVAKRLAGLLRARSALARLGGDEFGIVQTDLDDVENASGLARRLISAFELPFEVLERDIHISASVGIAVFPPGEADPRHLIKNADLALFRAKDEGRATYRFYAEEMDLEVRERMKLGQDLHGAIARRELFVEYQPQISMPGSTVVAAEALLRWRHPRRGLVGPAEFIPIAEASGLIVPIGEWVLRQACEAAKLWQDRTGFGIPVAVNLSAVQLKSPQFEETVEGVLKRSGLSHELLELELTEGILMQATAAAVQALARLRQRGVRFALDDFGRGYSSLEYLRKFELDKLKIDRTFIKGIDDRHDRVIVSTIAILGRKLGLEVVAEGVETEEQIEFLKREGCELLQGYYFSRPLLPATFRRLLVEGNGRLLPRPTAGRKRAAG